MNLSELHTDFGRSIPIAASPDASFGGWVLSGGLSLEMREYGLMIDSLIGFDILLCDNTLQTIIDPNYSGVADLSTSSVVSDEERDELLFAVRGSGGSNIGIVTRFYFKTHTIPSKQLYFSLSYAVGSADIITNAIGAFRDIFEDHERDTNLGMTLELKSVQNEFDADLSEQYPLRYTLQFEGVYSAKSDGLESGYEVVETIKSVIGNEFVETDSIISEELSYYEWNQRVLDGHGPLNFVPLTDGRYSQLIASRLVSESSDLSDSFIESFAARSMADINSYSAAYNDALQTFDFDSVVPIKWRLEAMGGNVGTKGEGNGCDKGTSFSGRDSFANLVVYNEFLTQTGKILAEQTRSEYEAILSQMSYHKALNYMDDITIGLCIQKQINQHNYCCFVFYKLTYADYDQYYFGERKFKKLVELKNKYNPQSCFNFEWQIPSKLSKCDKSKKHLSESDKNEIEKLISSDTSLADEYINNPSEDTFVALSEHMDNLWENDIHITSGYPFEYMVPNKDSFVNLVLDETEFIQSQRTHVSELSFHDFTTSTYGNVDTVTAKHTKTIQATINGQATVFVCDVSTNLIRRNNRDSSEWKIRSQNVDVTEQRMTSTNGHKKSGKFRANQETMPTQQELTCNSKDDELYADIIGKMAEKGYDVELATLTFQTVDSSNPNASLITFNVPFVNADSDYGVTVFPIDLGGIVIELPGRRLSGRDIMLFRGCTPPKVSYFSYRSYYSTDVLGVDANGALILQDIQASMGDSMNDIVMKTESGEPFDSLTNIATTADEQSYNDLKDVYDSIDGLNSDLLNLDSIPQEAEFKYSGDIPLAFADFPRSTITHLFRVVNNVADGGLNTPLLQLYQNRTQAR